MELLLAIGALLALDIVAAVAGHDSGEIEAYALRELRRPHVPNEVERWARRGWF